MAIQELLVNLLERFGLVVAAAFILLSWGAFRKLVLKETTSREKFTLILFFGAFGILGTYAGVPILGAIANVRAMAVITAGLFGGPIVGMGAGLIAGGHRLLIDIGGFSAIPCGLATFLEGLAAGYISVRLKEGVLNWRVAALIGIIGESTHMLIVLALARPFADAWALVKLISIPMILVNSLGAGLFVEIIRVVLKDRERIGSIQAQKALTIANQTVSHLRSGLNFESAKSAAQIIFNHISVAAVSITDDTHILAFIGAGEDHHRAGQVIQTKSTSKVIKTGKPLFLKDKAKVGCTVAQCPLQSAITVPLRKSKNIVGALKLYGNQDIHLNEIDLQIALGLADLFSTQLELEDIQLKNQMLARAEIRRLQSQINPHFLFNSLNTITSFCRTDPEKARELILEFSRYLRKNIEGNRDFIRIAEELQQIKSYLSLEQARFGGQIEAHVDIEEGCEEWPIPPLIIQPLVENAIKHGLLGQDNAGSIQVEITRHKGELHISVQDDGIGIEPKLVDHLLRKNRLEDHNGGIGIKNINQRLEQIYGPQYRMVMDSRPERGTTVHLRIPRTSSVV